MKTYYICPVIGTGVWGNPHRPKLLDQLSENGASIVPVIAKNADGTLVFPWCLVMVNAVNHDVFTAADVDRLPNITLDSKLSVLTVQQRNALLNFLGKRDIPTIGLDINSTFRQVVERVGKHLDTNFSANNFDAS